MPIKPRLDSPFTLKVLLYIRECEFFKELTDIIEAERHSIISSSELI